MFRTALRNVLMHKARLLMTVLAVMLGVAFVSGTLIFTSTISDAYRNGSEKGFSDVDVAVQPHKKSGEGKPGAPPDLTQQLLDRAAQVPHAASVTGTVTGEAAVADKDGDLIGQGFSTVGANYFAGVNGKDARYPMKRGRPPKAPNEVALDAKTAERAHYKVGNTARMSVDGPVMDQVIVGIFTTDDGNVAAGGTLVLFDTATAQKLFTRPGEFSEIYVKAQSDTDQNTLKAEIEGILPDHTRAVTGEKLADDQAAAVKRDMESMRMALLFFAVIALFVGIFTIANTFTVLVSQRTRELALLRAVGASRRQVIRSILVEAFVVGTAAAAAGFAVGVGIGALLGPLMRSTGVLIPDGPLVIPPVAVFTSLLVGVGVTMLAAWLPSRRAAKVPPVAAMGSVHAPAGARSLVLRNSVGALLGAGGLALILVARAGNEPASGPLALGSVLLLVGVIVLTPVLARVLIAAAAPALRLFGMPGRLARQNAVRNPRRTAATASALMIGLTLITGMTVVAVGLQRGLDKMATDGLRADYVISMVTKTPLSPQVEKSLDRLPEVTRSSPVRNSAARIEGKSKSLTGVDRRTMDTLTRLDFSAGSFSRLGGNHAVVDHKTADTFGWRVGSVFNVTYEDGRRARLTVTGLFEGNNLLNGIMVDTATLAPHQRHRTGDVLLLVKTQDGASSTVKDSLTRALGDNPALRVQDKEEVSKSISKMANLLLTMLYALLGVAVLVAVLGVINTLALSVFERTREIGILGAVGMDRGSIKRMIRLESVVISVFGGGLGILIGLFLSWSVSRLITERMATYELVLPWGRLGVFLVLAIVVGVIAALWPARGAAKINPLDAVKAE
ncbi:ABC transporter permease [Streptomyces sp. P1-3]|uniref:ABC transporter permease n=1 Tax=Streptomyces sp. P1-3 TaxID=3421658 RepID=UPI003D3619A6